MGCSGGFQCRRQPGGSDGQAAGGSQDWVCVLSRSKEETRCQTCWSGEASSVEPSRSRGPSGHGGNKEIVDILLEDENEPPMAGGRRERRPNRGPASQVGYQRERDVTGMVGSTGVNGTDDSDELMRKLRAL